jgi:3-hydroxyisobutyrate dehydrogenase
MARHLVNAGYELVVFDLNEEPVHQLVQLDPKRIQKASSVKRTGPEKSLDLIITMLPAGPHVRSVYLQADGILANVSKSTRLIDCSTIDPQTAREVHQCAHQQGNSMLDAPVSGGTGGAQAATLTFMVGGDTR